MSQSDLEGRPCPSDVLRTNAAAMAVCVLGTDLPHTLPPLAEAAFYLLQPRRRLPRGFLKQTITPKGLSSAYGITELPDGSLVLSNFIQGVRLVRKADRNKVDEHGVVAVDDNTCTTPFPGHSTETLYLPDVKVLINCSTSTELAAYKVDFSEQEEGGGNEPPRFSKLWSIPAHQPVSVCRLGKSPFLAVSTYVQKRLGVFKLDLQSLSTAPMEFPVESSGTTAYLRVSAIPGTESSLLFTTASSSIQRMDIHINKANGAVSGCTIHPAPIASGESYYGICCVDGEWAMTSTGSKLKRFRHYSLQGGVTTQDTNEMSDIHRKAPNRISPSSGPLASRPKRAPALPSPWASTPSGTAPAEDDNNINAHVVFVSDVSGDTLIGRSGNFFVYE